MKTSSLSSGKGAPSSAGSARLAAVGSRCGTGSSLSDVDGRASLPLVDVGCGRVGSKPVSMLLLLLLMMSRSSGADDVQRMCHGAFAHVAAITRGAKSPALRAAPP